MFPSTIANAKNSGGSSRTNHSENDVLSVLSCHVETVVLLSHKSPDSVINVNANVKHFFTLLGKMFFTSYGKEFFTYLGKQIFTS